MKITNSPEYIKSYDNYLSGFNVLEHCLKDIRKKSETKESQIHPEISKRKKYISEIDMKKKLLLLHPESSGERIVVYRDGLKIFYFK